MTYEFGFAKLVGSVNAVKGCVGRGLSISVLSNS